MKNGEVFREFSLRACMIGLGLIVLLTGANAFIGLKAGITISASIPAAVMGVGLFRMLRRRASIHEINIIQTMGSAGESLAAGIIFTLPALLLVGVWTEFYFWETTAVALLGGWLGVLIMIFFRRKLITDSPELQYPEGTACADVLKTGNKEGDSGFGLVLQGLGLGTLFQFVVKGLKLVASEVNTGFAIGRAKFAFGTEVSVGVLAVGYIIGLNVALLVFIGGAIAWFVAIPFYAVLVGTPEENVVKAAWGIWSTQIRYLGVGAMVVAGVATIVSVFPSIMASIRTTIAGLGSKVTRIRTDEDMSMSTIAILLVVVAYGILVLYSAILGVGIKPFIAWVTALVVAGFFVAVSSYIVGLLGNSSNPVSGMTICAILIIAGLMVLMGVEGKLGMAAALMAAGVVCCAACTAGDTSNDLKTGYLVGTTPAKQQWAQLLGVTAAAVIMSGVLNLLNRAWAIGSKNLPAPQAKLFAGIIEGFFGDKPIPWNMVAIGVVLGTLFVIANQILKSRGSRFHASPMALAVGIYLPIHLAVPMVLGGIIKTMVRGRFPLERDKAESADQRGVLFASGLIAGEGITAIALAIAYVTSWMAPDAEGPAIGWLGVLFVLATAYLIWHAAKDESQQEKN